jgi:predicted metal-dependent hydrolase
MQQSADYDVRYLAGILFFNEREFFEAHEVWEDLWADIPGPERRFIQGLIQAAVGLYHFGNSNLRGARKLYQTSSAYMQPFGDRHLGLDNRKFWEGMARCFAPILETENMDTRLVPDDALIPTISLSPEPAAWPNLTDFRDPRS